MDVQTESNTPTETMQECLLLRGSIVQVEGMPFQLKADTRVLGHGANILAVGIPLAPPDTDLTCFEKARANGEETFTLRSQDITADLVVDFWAIVQIRVMENMNAGLTRGQAVQAVRSYFFLESVNSPRYPTGHVKLDTAVMKADVMRQWPNRKLAD